MSNPITGKRTEGVRRDMIDTLPATHGTGIMIAIIIGETGGKEGDLMIIMVAIVKTDVITIDICISARQPSYHLKSSWV